MVMTMMVHDGGGAWFTGPSGQGFSASEAANISADRLTASCSSLRAAVDAAVKKDRDESRHWWDEFLSFLEHGLLGYKKDREEFEAKGEALIAECYAFVDSIEQLVAQVQAEAGPVPDQLEDDAAGWQEQAERVAEIRGRITQVKQIPGWFSGASSSYTARSTVQDGATEELRGVALSMANAISRIALFNRALFLVMDREIRATVSLINDLQGGADGYHFRRAANAIGTLSRLEQDLSDARYARPVAQSASELQGQVSECLAAPQLLQPEQWPTGGGQAATPPAATDSVPDPDAADSQVDNPTGPRAPGGNEDGVKR